MHCVLSTWATGRALSVWGLGAIAAPSWVDPSLQNTFRALHAVSANAILWLVGLHVAAALVHHYLFNDGLIDRMLPARLRRRLSGFTTLI